MTSNMGITNFNSLPLDVMSLIYSYSSPHAQVQLASVSKAWHAFTKQTDTNGIPHHTKALKALHAATLNDIVQLNRVDWRNTDIITQYCPPAFTFKIMNFVSSSIFLSQFNRSRASTWLNAKKHWEFCHLPSLVPEREADWIKLLIQHYRNYDFHIELDQDLLPLGSSGNKEFHACYRIVYPVVIIEYNRTLPSPFSSKLSEWILASPSPHTPAHLETKCSYLRGSFHVWKQTDLKGAPLKRWKLISDMVSLQMLRSITAIVNSNLIFFSSIKRIEDISSTLTYQCDVKGQLQTPEAIASGIIPLYTLRILPPTALPLEKSLGYHMRSSMTPHLLPWTLDDHLPSLSLQDLLRKVVISYTVKQLAIDLGLCIDVAMENSYPKPPGPPLAYPLFERL